MTVLLIGGIFTLVKCDLILDGINDKSGQDAKQQGQQRAN